MNPRCIEPLKLYDYIIGRLSKQDRDSVEAHLADCDMCLQRFVTAKALLEDSDLMENTAPVKDLGAPIMKALLAGAKRFLEWTIEPMAEPAFAVAVRDNAGNGIWEKKPSSDYIKTVKPLGKSSCEMIFKKTKPLHFDLHVELVGNVDENSRFSLVLAREKDKFDARILSDGSADFTNLSFDRFDLVLEQNGEPCGEFSFEITQDGIYEQPGDSS